MTTSGPTQNELIQQLVEMTTAVVHQATPIDPNALARLVGQEVTMQESYAQIIEDLVSPESRTAHPFWGFFIDGKNPKTGERVEIARTVIPKVLDTSATDYLAQLAAWTNTYMLAITPAARAAWRAVGFTVQFFQTAEAPKPTEPKPKLQLVR